MSIKLGEHEPGDPEDPPLDPENPPDALEPTPLDVLDPDSPPDALDPTVPLDPTPLDATPLELTPDNAIPPELPPLDVPEEDWPPPDDAPVPSPRSMSLRPQAEPTIARAVARSPIRRCGARISALFLSRGGSPLGSSSA